MRGRRRSSTGPGPCVQVSLRMPRALLEQIDELARLHAWTRTQVIELVVELGLAARTEPHHAAPLELRELRKEGIKVADSLEELARWLRSSARKEGGPFDGTHRS